MAFAERTGRNSWRVRYWTDDGIHGSISGFATKQAALAKAREIDTDRRRGSFLDPAAGKVLLADYLPGWLDALDVAPATESQYRSLTRNHIQPRWGHTALADIDALAARTWARQLRARLAASTVTTITKVLSMMLADAAEHGLIPANPIRAHRRGRRRHTARAEAVWADPEQALRIALQAADLAGGWAAILIITAAWTGARWGELTGLQRHNLHLGTHNPRIVIDPENGALHEVDGLLFLGPPKTAESARPVTLPPFLAALLTRHLATHDHPHVFVTAEGELLRRSNFARRAMRPATDGNLDRTRPRPRAHPVVPGLTFHGLRHSHKTWLIADAIPTVAQARRLGHTLPDKIEEIYSHVAPEIETRLLTALDTRWADAVAAIKASHQATAAQLPPLLALPAA